MTTMTIDIYIQPNGMARCVYTDALPLRELGTLDVQRASTVEFNPTSQCWEVIITGETAPRFTNPSRETCLEYERGFVSARLEQVL